MCTRSGSRWRRRSPRPPRYRRGSPAGRTSAAWRPDRRPTSSCSTTTSRSSVCWWRGATVSRAEPQAGSLVRAEIAEQPAAVARVLADADGAIAAAAQESRRRRPRYVVIAARGSSDNAARYAQHVLGRLCGLPVALAAPSLHTVYDAPMRYADGVVLGISQSGASPDVVAVLEAARAQGCVTVALTNDAGSPMAAAATHVIELQAGVEASVAATKTYTTSLAAVAALAAGVAGQPERRAELAGAA